MVRPLVHSLWMISIRSCIYPFGTTWRHGPHVFPLPPPAYACLVPIFALPHPQAFLDSAWVHVVGTSNFSGGVMLSFLFSHEQLITLLGVRHKHSPRVLKACSCGLKLWHSANDLISSDRSGLLEETHFGRETWRFEDAIGSKTPGFPLGKGLVPLRPVLGNQPEQYNCDEITPDHTHTFIMRFLIDTLTICFRRRYCIFLPLE